MIKEDLEKLRNKVIDPYVTKNLYYIINSYEEEQLDFMLAQTGIKINENIVLFRREGLGYKCFGKTISDSPTCIMIERFLNKKGQMKIVD